MNKRIILRYTLAGALFGVVFPVVATLLRIFENGLGLSWKSVTAVQSGDSLQWIIDSAPLFLGLFAGFGGLRQARVLQLNQALNQHVTDLEQTTHDLQELKSELEKRVAERTLALETSIEISRRLSTVLEVEPLVREVVEQVKLAFNYYHVHIYLMDREGENLVLAAGTGEAGKALLARGHKVPRGKGLVGRAVNAMQPILSADVSREPGWLPNPLLPETASEVAVPIALGRNLLGVLDVQQDKVGGLTKMDADLLQSIANQVAIALQNARMYTRINRRANREALANYAVQKIQQASSVDELLKVAVAEVGRALGTRYVSVEIGEQHRAGSGFPPGTETVEEGAV